MGILQRVNAARRLIIWLVLWAVLYVFSVFLYNFSYPVTLEVLIYYLQVEPAAWLLQLTLPDHEIISDDAVIKTGRKALEVMRGCDGIEAWLLLATSLAVFPMSWRRRLRSLVLGSVLIYSLNLARIVSLFHIMLSKPEWLDLAHGLIWQSIMVLSALGFVLYWMHSDESVNIVSGETS